MVLGGHSMGGGTSVLAADPGWAPGTVVDALVLFAPGLYTLPPAYSHRANVRARAFFCSNLPVCAHSRLLLARVGAGVGGLA